MEKSCDLLILSIPSLSVCNKSYQAVTTNSLDMSCVFGFYGDTSGHYFIVHFILIDTLLNEKTDLLAFSLFIDTQQDKQILWN